MSVSVLTIEPRDKTPIYAQIEHGLRAAIATGRLGLGEQLPTVRQLAVQLQVNANTVARVYADLEKAGVLETRRGVGSFVAVGRDRARPAGEKARRLNAFVMRALADANQAGFTVDELIGGLTAHRREGA